MKPSRHPPGIGRFVAQIFNLPYRRILFCGLPVLPAAQGYLHALQTEGLRYSRLKICATACAVLFCAASALTFGQDAQPASDKKKADVPVPAVTQEGSNPAKAEATPEPAAAETAAVAAGQDASIKGAQDKSSSSDEIQLSLQGANIDMVVQWLAQTTGKTVIKHPRVQCQLTITSSKKLTKREAITLVYRALSLEGFTATESSTAILLTPEGQEPKMSPELVEASRKDIPEGRQRLVKIFPLQHMQAMELREKLRGVLSDKGTIETDDRANELIVTDYNENLKLLAELIREFDVADSDSAIQIYPLKYADAEEVANLIGLILNVTAPSGGQTKSSSSAPSSSPPPMPGGPMMMPGGGPPQPSGGGSPAASGIGSAVSAPQVRLWPDRSSNRLIVSAPKSKLAEVQRLIDILDTDQPEDVSVRSIPLKNVAATDLVRELAPIYQKMGGKSRKDTIEVGANDRSNSLIVLSSEANFRAIEKLVSSLDTEDAQEKVVQTFILKNADAQDAAKQLQELSRDQDSSSRYPYYYFFSGSSGSDKGRKKMSVVADRRRNALVVQAPPAQMPGIEKMVQELDEPITDDSLAPKIFHLKYVSAVDIEDVLNELFLKKTQQRPYFYFYDEEPQTQTDRDVGRLYGKVRITSEPYSNTIIVTSNSKENLAVVEEVLKQLDSPSEAGESTLRIGLRFAKASIVANSINILFAKNGSPPLRPVAQQGQPGAQQPQQQQQQQQNGSAQAGFDLEQETKEEGYFPWLGGQPDSPRTSDGRTTVRPVSDLVGRVRAVADQRSNALLISANVHYFPQVLKLIEELDAPTDQVLIEARLVEVSSDFLDKLGVRWSPDGSQVFTGDDFDNSFLGHVQGNYQKGFGGTTTVNSPPQTSSGVLQSLTTLRSGVLGSTISMDFLVQFLRRTTDAKVLAEPQINIRDNETGRLFVGQQVPIPQYTQVSTIGSQNTSFTYKDVGVVLEVTPHINSSGDVELRIHAESSTVVPGQTVLGGSIFDTRNFRTDLTAKNGQTLVLGGIIQKQVTDTLRKTPILGDIPGLGWAFKKKDKTSHEVELMVFMRPRVTRTPEQNRDLLDEIYRKVPAVKKWDQESQQQSKPAKTAEPE
jgi:type II secretion system protein D